MRSNRYDPIEDTETICLCQQLIREETSSNRYDPIEDTETLPVVWQEYTEYSVPTATIQSRILKHLLKLSLNTEGWRSNRYDPIEDTETSLDNAITELE